MRRRAAAARALAPALALCLTSAAAGAQGGVLLQGLADVEAWKTRGDSRLLERNDGRAALLGRVHLWSAWEPVPGLALYGMAEAVGGPAAEEGEVEIDQAGVRWSRSPRLVVDAGILTSPVGAFGGRRLSSRNPLVGAPDGYPVTYPLGAQLSGTARILDWRAAAVSLPVTHEEYTPDPTPRARPALGAGVRPLPGLRVGASWTAGPYLNRGLPDALLAGRRWTAYDQRVAGVDVEASHGYLELWAEASRSAYDVPGRARPVRGTAGYLEARWTFGPRWYAAARAEVNDYPFVQPAGDSSWIAQATEVRDAELGLGFRPSSHQIVKLTWRRDQWRVEPALRPVLPDGHAVAVQLSQSFDVMALVDRARR